LLANTLKRSIHVTPRPVHHLQRAGIDRVRDLKRIRDDGMKRDACITKDRQVRTLNSVYGSRYRKIPISGSAKERTQVEDRDGLADP
jgi:hypothetical protein